MNWNQHWNLNGKHAFLAPSQSAWLRYSKDKLYSRWVNSKAAEEGTKKHALACELIKQGWKLSARKDTIAMYVNDCITDKMSPEVLLYYSDNVFGTADAIRFAEEDKALLIYDLKTGESGGLEQLEVYAALFCLEYRKKPEDLNYILLRLYKNKDVEEENADPLKIRAIMDTIVEMDEWLKEFKDDVI